MKGDFSRQYPAGPVGSSELRVAFSIFVDSCASLWPTIPDFYVRKSDEG